MIALLTGRLVRRREDAVVIDCGGVGYLAFVSGEALRRMPAEGGTVTLEIHTHVREDALHLFGFIDALEKETFEMLISVSGVGPKMAMNVLSGLPAENLARALVQEDLATLTKISGVGKKTAERLIVELRARAKTLAFPVSSSVPRLRAVASKESELASALLNLGYRSAEVENVVAEVMADQPDLALEPALRESLRRMR